MVAETLTLPSLLFSKKGISSVSFALFGTLLLRRCLSVEAVFERALHHAPVPARLKSQAETFVQHRTLAQNMLRINRGGGNSVSMVSGISIEAIYDRFAVHALNLPASIRPQLVAAELKAEQDLCFVNPDALAMIAAARKLGRRVGLVAETHWFPDQVRALLAKVAPDLTLDFLYTSAMPEVYQAGSLFRLYLQSEKLRPAKALHIGVDEDTVEQATGGVAFHPYQIPQDPWESRYKREEAAARMLAMSDGGFHWRLDGGLRLIRRVAVAEVGPIEPHHAVAAAVLGPVMVGFQRHIERRVADLSGPGRRVKVMFLARDAYLSMRLWSAANAGPADYVDMNRRIAIIAGSEGAGGFATLEGLISSMPFVRREGVEDFFKDRLPAKARAFFPPNRMTVVGGTPARLLPPPCHA